MKKILAVLLNQNNSAANNLLLLDETQKWVAQSYIPAVLADEPQELSELTIVAKIYGINVFLSILAAASMQSKAKLLGLLVGNLPLLLQQEFLEILEGSFNIAKCNG